MGTNVEQEVLDATGYIPDKTQDRQSHLRSLTKKAKALEDDDWYKLSGSAQEWVSQMMQAIKNGDELPEPLAKANGRDSEPAPKKTKKKKAKAAATEEKTNVVPFKKEAKKVKAAKPEKSKKPVGAQSMIKKIVLKNPRISTDDLLEQLTKKGYKVTKFAASTIRSGMRHTLKIIKEEGVDVLKLEL